MRVLILGTNDMTNHDHYRVLTSFLDGLFADFGDELEVVSWDHRHPVTSLVSTWVKILGIPYDLHANVPNIAERKNGTRLKHSHIDLCYVICFGSSAAHYNASANVKFIKGLMVDRGVEVLPVVISSDKYQIQEKLHSSNP